nr:40S ribosomal protein S3-1-like [Tanacetum cinerariifolium]
MKARKKNIEAKYSTWFDALNSLPEHQLRQFAAKLEQREHDARTRLEFKKRNMNITYPYPHNFGNMSSMYHFVGLGLGKPDHELDHHHMLMNHEPMAVHGYPSVDYGRNVYDNNLNHSYLSFHQQQGGNNNPYLSFHQQKPLLQGGNNPYFSFHQQQGLVQGGMLSQFEPQEHDFHASNGGAGDFVADRVFFTELNEVLPRELAEDGSSGVESGLHVCVLRSSSRMIREKRRRITELTSLVQKRFKFPETMWSFTPNELTTKGSVPLPRPSHCEFAIQASRRACCPQLIVCRACYGVIRFIVENGAKEVLEAKTIEVLKVGTEHNAADALTNVVPGHKLQHCLELLSVGIG